MLDAGFDLHLPVETGTHDLLAVKVGPEPAERLQIAVDHRYANAGKWKEQTVQGRPGESVMVAQADELKPNQMKLLHVDGRRIVLARTDDGFAAFDDHCPHRGGSLADGVMACGTVVCPWHGSEFDVATGALTDGRFGLFRWDMRRSSGGASPHYHRTFSE